MARMALSSSKRSRSSMSGYYYRSSYLALLCLATR
jgi:hypothetical protein